MGFGSPREGEQEYLGRPEYRPVYAEGTRDVREATISFAPPGGKPFDVHCTPVLPVHLMAGTGYGLEPDWKHGMYQGPGPVVQGVVYTLPQDADRLWGMVDSVGRFEYDDPSGSHQIGHGLYEYWALGPHPSFPEA
nr:hypothetical protein GCM10020093_076630 [Planobispora longispora]